MDARPLDARRRWQRHLLDQVLDQIELTRTRFLDREADTPLGYSRICDDLADLHGRACRLYRMRGRGY